ncbi:hypothetical protein D623_10003811 [Myotis brandtii]|uniref:Uncharacterized protein n=1 Tax=Myotis brandtii TaxID=109478 RepID=S7P396_MYOBR|nr:hypothetical protein D623_10003811 [Myotis brandtii]
MLSPIIPRRGLPSGAQERRDQACQSHDLRSPATVQACARARSSHQCYHPSSPRRGLPSGAQERQDQACQSHDLRSPATVQFYFNRFW